MSIASITLEMFDPYSDQFQLLAKQLVYDHVGVSTYGAKGICHVMMVDMSALSVWFHTELLILS